MKKLIGFASAATMLATLAATQTSAQPASKFTAIASNVALVEPTQSQSWTTVMSTTIKTPNKKDLLIGGSLETALYTSTVVKSFNGQTDTSVAGATLDVRLVIDGRSNYAYPNEVTYDKRVQTLTAKLGGPLAQCNDANGDGVIDPDTECPLTLDIGLILDTMAAHHYNFVAANLEPGDHTCELQIRVDTETAFVNGTATAWAAVGKGSLSVEEVRATNAPDGIEFLE